MQLLKDTLKSPPPENVTMRKASVIAVIITTFFYICCGCFGYAAFGNDTPGNLLTGFAFSRPHWLVDFANACIVVHLVGAYQVHIIQRYHPQILLWHFHFMYLEGESWHYDKVVAL